MRARMGGIGHSTHGTSAERMMLRSSGISAHQSRWRYAPFSMSARMNAGTPSLYGA